MKLLLSVILTLFAVPSISQNLSPRSKFYGKYSAKGLIVQITQVDSVLVLIVPGAPLQSLIPIHDNKFKTNTFGDEIFVFNEKKGKVTEMVSQRGNGSLRLKKTSDIPDDLNSGGSLLTLKKATDHFLFFYSEVDVNSITSLSLKLENDYERIVKDFKVESLPITEVRIYPTLESFHKGIYFPNAPSNILATAFGKNDFRMVSPESVAGDSVLLYKGMSHEFTHCVHLNIDYSPNNPRWLWEGIAMYEANWFLDPKGISAIRNRKFPHLNSLTDGMEYSLGFVVIEAIKDLWGFDTVIDLIKKRGNSTEVVKLTEKEFETAIFNRIYDKYVVKK